MSSYFGESPTALSNLPSNSFLFRKIMDDTTLKFRLFNCDRTFNLDKVEKLINQVAEKLSLKKDVEKRYFALPRMNELCEELEKEGGHFQYAVFVVHAHESRLSLNEKNAGIGYAKFYRTLQKVTDDRVLIVIGGDDNYKGQEERDKKVLSRWVWHKICSQFTEDYLNGVKSFIFSWEDNHHPIHEEALEFYLDPKKKGQEFVPRPRPAPVTVPTKEDTKMIELPKDDPLMSQQLKQKPLEMKLSLEKEFPPEKNANRNLPTHTPKGSIADRTGLLQKENEMMKPQTQVTQSHTSQPYTARYSQDTHSFPEVQERRMSDLHVLSFYSKKESVLTVEKLLEEVYMELNIPSKPSKQFWHPKSIPQEILKNQPKHLVLVSDFDDFKDFLSNQDNQIETYHEIYKNSREVDTKLVFVITEDKEYREGYLSSDAVQNIFSKLDKRILRSEQPLILSWNKTPWTIHRSVLVQLLSPQGDARAESHQYRTAEKPDVKSRTLPFSPQYDSTNKPRLKYYRALIKYGHVKEVLTSDPPGWKPDGRHLTQLLQKHGNEEKATVEFWEKEDGTLQSSVQSSGEANLSKIAEGFGTDKMHSILVYSYHSNKEAYETMSNFVHHLKIPVLSPCQPMDLASMIHDINGTKPDYVMFSADIETIEALQDSEEVKKLIQQHGSEIKDSIKYCVGKGVILMLVGDKFYRKGELASVEVSDKVKMLIQDVVSPYKLTVMTCHSKPYVTHQNWMKEHLHSKKKNLQSKEEADPEKHILRYKATIVFGRVEQVMTSSPPDWKPEEYILADVLQKYRNEEKATLEFWENQNGQVNPIVTVPKKSFFPSISIPSSLPSFPSSLNPFSKGKQDKNKSDVV